MQLTLARWAAALALLTALAAGCGAASTNNAAVTGHASLSPARTATQMTTPVKTPAPTATRMTSRLKTPAARHRRHHHHRATVPTVTAPAAPAAPPASMNPIPQGNGGDHDADNNGGPVDGDGAI
jgi:predicted aminopeptidase